MLRHRQRTEKVIGQGWATFSFLRAKIGLINDKIFPACKPQFVWTYNLTSWASAEKKVMHLKRRANSVRLWLSRQCRHFTGKINWTTKRKRRPHIGNGPKSPIFKRRRFPGERQNQHCKKWRLKKSIFFERNVPPYHLKIENSIDQEWKHESLFYQKCAFLSF